MSRIRLKGRDIDIFMFGEDDVVRHSGQQTEAEVLKAYHESDLSVGEGFQAGAGIVAGIGCRLSSSSEYTTIVDKSTPVHGIKQLERVNWSISGDYNIANLNAFHAIYSLHQQGTAFMIVLAAALSPSMAEDTGRGFGIYTDERRGAYKGNKIIAEALDKKGRAEGFIHEVHNDFMVGYAVIQSVELVATDGQLATFSMTLEGVTPLYRDFVQSFRISENGKVTPEKYGITPSPPSGGGSSSGENHLTV